jgi:multiple sugar transport system permease protein
MGAKDNPITVATFAFYWNWDDFLAPLIYLNDPKLYTQSLALRSFADPASVTNWGESSRWESLG